ncbi:MAG: hypothetical protein WC139_00245 [Candidatus Kapaibacterium sp.]
MKYLFIILFILFSSSLFAQKLMLFGGENHDVYLGCLTCTQYHSESVWNESGIYGTKFNNLSIWSEFSDFGNEFSHLSPWNEYATAPPKIIDENGVFIGYFTRNPYYKQRTEDEFFIYVLNNFRYISENFSKFVEGLYF